MWYHTHLLNSRRALYHLEITSTLSSLIYYLPKIAVIWLKSGQKCFLHLARPKISLDLKQQRLTTVFNLIILYLRRRYEDATVHASQCFSFNAEFTQGNGCLQLPAWNRLISNHPFYLKITSRCLGNKISESQQTVVLQVWQKATKKLNCACVTFLCMILLRNKTLAHTFLPSFDNANGSLSWKTVEIQRFCSYGNLTAYFSFLLNTLVEEVDRKERKRAISFPSSLSPRCLSILLRPFCDRLRERQEATEDESAGSTECKDVTFKLP